MRLNIKNEYDKLVKVVLAPVEKEYLEQQKQLLAILKKYNVEVIMLNKCEDAKYQMFTRDPFIVIDNKLIISYMKENIRRAEINTIKEYLNKIDNSMKIFLHKDTFIEGGDIIVHKNIIFIGQNGNRTNEQGLKFLKKTFEPKYKVIPLFMINPNKNIPWIHLDCLFNPLSSDTAIIYKNGFKEESFNILKKLFTNLIYINDKEQSELATNVFSLGNKTIIMQKRHNELIKKIKNYGFSVEIMDRYETIKELGYTRCLTCPLERE